MSQTNDNSNASTEYEQVFGNVEQIDGIRQLSVYDERVTYRNLTEKQYRSSGFGCGSYIEVYEFVSISQDMGGEVIIKYTVEPARDCDDDLLDWNGLLEHEFTRVDSVEEAAEVVEEFVRNVR